MARIHPSAPLHAPLTAGDYRERDVLRILGDGLPADFDVFHNLPWSSMHQGNQHSGELDLVVISPLGHILLIEVKAGAIEEFRSELAQYIASNTPVAITRHGQTVGYFIPTHG